MALIIDDLKYSRIENVDKKFNEKENIFIYNISIVNYKNSLEREKDKKYFPIYQKSLKIIDEKLEEITIPLEAMEVLTDEQYKEKIKNFEKNWEMLTFLKRFIKKNYFISYDEVFDKGFIQYKLYSLKDFIESLNLNLSFLLDPVFIDSTFIDIIESEKDLDNYYEIYKEYLDSLDAYHEDC